MKCGIEDSKLSFHKYGVIFFKQKKLKKYKFNIKESGIRLFFGPRDFATSGE